MRSHLKNSWVFLFFLVSFVSFAGPSHIATVHKARENWASVEEGIFYRSQKLTSNQLLSRIRQHQIKSILCLAECTEEEQGLALELGVKYYNRSMNIPEIELSDLNGIIQILKDAPKPLLVHCRKGADRTGMAVALYFYAIKEQDLKTSMKKGLRLRYGHLGKMWTPRIYEVLQEFESQN
ncbi:MAG: tyrosine-protein phosphatase [Bdellovibrionota bacterium]